MPIDFTGKRLGKLTVVGEVERPNDWRGFRYKCRWYRCECECGNVRDLPSIGLANYKSCGCSRSDHLKVMPLPSRDTIRNFPDKPPVLLSMREHRVYTDL